MKIYVITTTVRKRGEADEIVRRLIEERLAACAHLERISSSYNWSGVERSDDEWRIAFKTSGLRHEAAIERLRKLHSYEVPMIIWREEETTDAYAAWVEEQASGDSSTSGGFDESEMDEDPDREEFEDDEDDDDDERDD